MGPRKGKSAAMAPKVSRADAPTGGKADKCGCPPGGAKKKRKNKETYSTYIHRVLKQIDPESGISKRGMDVMNSFVCDLFERLMNESAQLRKVNNNVTVTSREIQTATRLLLSGELAKHAVSEGTKAVTMFNSSAPGSGGKKGGSGKGGGCGGGGK